MFGVSVMEAAAAVVAVAVAAVAMMLMAAAAFLRCSSSAVGVWVSDRFHLPGQSLLLILLCHLYYSLSLFLLLFL